MTYYVECGASGGTAPLHNAHNAFQRLRQPPETQSVAPGRGTRRWHKQQPNRPQPNPIQQIIYVRLAAMDPGGAQLNGKIEAFIKSEVSTAVRPGTGNNGHAGLPSSANAVFKEILHNSSYPPPPPHFLGGGVSYPQSVTGRTPFNLTSL